MPWTSEHTKWLVDTDERLNTADGTEVEVWEFRHENDEAVLVADFLEYLPCYRSLTLVIVTKLS